MTRLTANKIALGICFFFVILAICSASLTPAFEPPDEAAHFLYIHNILVQGRLPVQESRDAEFKSQSTQRHQPPLYYLIGAALISWTHRADVADYLHVNPFAAVGTVLPNNQNVFLHPLTYPGDTGTAIWILRLYSIALATITLWCLYLTGKLAYSNSVGLLAMLMAASLPEFIFIGSSVNNDNLVTVVYAAGVYLCVRMWRRCDISRADIAITSLVLAAAALSKLTGLTLFGVVYLAVLYGALRRRYSWSSAVRLILISLVVSGGLAGWWYVRNQLLYGDPLAFGATMAIWARGATNLITLSELHGVWESFWMILGHFNLRGPDWLYTYVIVITVIGVLGIIVAWLRRPKWRDTLALLIGVCVVVIASLIAATRQINVSQGRLLFPALVAFAPLMAVGWQALLTRRIGRLLVVPMAILAVATPAYYLPTAYARLQTYPDLPAGVNPLSIRAETLTIRGYQLASDTVSPGDVLRLWVYFSGTHADNPNMFVKAIHPATNNAIAGVDFYPGMAPTTGPEQSGTIYRGLVAFQLDRTPQPAPVQLHLQIGWNASGRFLPLADSSGRPLGSLIVDGPTLIDPSQQPATPSVKTDVTFGNAIKLGGYSLSTDNPAPGSTLNVALQWRCLNRINADLREAVGLMDADNNMVAQADGIPLGYPTVAWRPGPDFPDVRQITLPADLAPGTYKLYVGWYDPVSGVRLPANGSGTVSALNFFQSPIMVKAAH